MITFKDGKIILEKEDYFCLNCGGLYQAYLHQKTCPVKLSEETKLKLPKCNCDRSNEEETLTLCTWDKEENWSDQDQRI